MKAWFADHPLEVDGTDYDGRDHRQGRAERLHPRGRGRHRAHQQRRRRRAHLLGHPGHRQPGLGAVRGELDPVHHDGRPVAALRHPRRRQARRPAVQLPLLLGPRGRRRRLLRHLVAGDDEQEGRRPLPQRPRRPGVERELPRPDRGRAASPSTTPGSTPTAPRTSPPRSPRSRAPTSCSASRSRRTSPRSGRRPSSRATRPRSPRSARRCCSRPRSRRSATSPTTWPPRCGGRPPRRTRAR